MSLPIQSELPASYASRILSALRSAYAQSTRAQTELVNDNFSTIVNIPSGNKLLQDLISSAQSSGNITRIISQINESLPSDVTISDISSFATKYDSLAADIESNAALFVLSINPTTKRTQFINPVSTGVKTAISSRITSLLAEII